MKTIPEPIQNCNHRLQNCNDPRNLYPSNSTDLENRQGSTAYPDAKTMDSETLFNCFRSAEIILHTTCAESVGFLFECFSPTAAGTGNTANSSTGGRK